MLALLAAAGALGCGVAALWVGLLPVIGSWAAALACAGVLLLAAIVMIASGYALLRRRDRSKVASSGTAEAIASGDIGQLVAPLIREHKWLLLVLAAVAGATTVSKVGTNPRRKS
jgi:membrane protein implicated in regulation of membrane protease activity